MHDLGLLTDYEVQVWRSRVSYTEYDARRLEKIIDQFIQFSMRLPCVIAMEKHNHGQRLRMFLIGVSDDEPNQLAERLFSSRIAGGCSSFERNGLERFG